MIRFLLTWINRKLPRCASCGERSGLRDCFVDGAGMIEHGEVGILCSDSTRVFLRLRLWLCRSCLVRTRKERNLTLRG